jgi:hypothetical protein
MAVMNPDFAEGTASLCPLAAEFTFGIRQIRDQRGLPPQRFPGETLSV